MGDDEYSLFLKMPLLASHLSEKVNERSGVRDNGN